MSEKDSSGTSPKRSPVHFEPLDEAMNTKGDWQRDLVNRLAFASLNEQRRTRRWNIFFRFLLALYLGAILLFALFAFVVHSRPKEAWCFGTRGT